MRTLAIIFLALAVLSWLVSISFRTPWNGGFNDFAWVSEKPHFELAIGLGHFVVVYPLTDGYQCWNIDWRVRFNISKRFTSIEHSRLIRDDRIWSWEPSFDPTVRDEYIQARDRDELYFWQWPQRGVGTAG